MTRGAWQRLLVVVGGASLVAGIAHADAALDYMLHCRGCHGPRGEGAPPDVPDLRIEIGRLVARPGGREFVLRVPGVVQSELSDERTARLLNWMVEAFGGATATRGLAPFTTEEVARHRLQPLVDVDGARPE